MVRLRDCGWQVPSKLSDIYWVLMPLSLTKGGTKYIEIYMFLADEDGAGPATRALAEEIGKQVCR